MLEGEQKLTQTIRFSNALARDGAARPHTQMGSGPSYKKSENIVGVENACRACAALFLMSYRQNLDLQTIKARPSRFVIIAQPLARLQENDSERRARTRTLKIDLVRRASPTLASVILPMINGGTFCSHIYSSLATHAFTASSTARDRSPFLPPNLSTVLNLRLLSNSSESSTLMRPIPITYYQFCARFARVTCFSNKQIGQCQVLLLFLLSFSIHPKFAYTHKMLCGYQLIRISV